jgi:transcription elongation GreA/GreB family factor
MTVTRFIEEALRDRLGQRMEDTGEQDRQRQAEIEERNRLMEALLQRTAHFRIGPKPTREEMNER